MAIEELIKNVLAASPAKRNEIESIINGTKPKQDELRLVGFLPAARLMGLSRTAIYDLVETKRLDTIELNGSRKITMKSILEFVNGERPATKATAARIKANRARQAKYSARKAETKEER